jgi:hypothetical protein
MYIKLGLPLKIRVHLTFHVSLLKPFKENTLWLDYKQVIWPPPKLVGNHLEYELEGFFKNKNLNIKNQH